MEFLSGFRVEILVFKDCFHGFQLFLHLPQMLTRNLIHMAQFVVCSQLRTLIRRKQFRDRTHEIWTMEMILAQVILKLFQTVLERKLVKNVFLLQKL